MKDLRSPQEVLHNLLIWLPDRFKRLPAGQVVSHLPDKVREKLKKLTSRDTCVRWDIVKALLGYNR